MRLFGLHLHRCDDPWDGAPPWAVELRAMMELLLKETRQLETYEMATKENLDKMKAVVAANTNATAAATVALNHYAQSNADLTKQLQDAIAASDASDDEDVKAAIDALTANNTALTAAVPETATAVTANTPAAAQV